RKYANKHAESSESRSSREPWFHRFSLLPAPVMYAVAAVLLLVIGLGVWRAFFYRSEVDKGLVALNNAYSQQRPVESRISNLNYAPYVVTRGPADEKSNQAELTRAEATLLNELNQHRSAAALHAVGKLYLAKRQYDSAIDYLQQALT